MRTRINDLSQPGHPQRGLADRIIHFIRIHIRLGHQPFAAKCLAPQIAYDRAWHQAKHCLVRCASKACLALLPQQNTLLGNTSHVRRIYMCLSHRTNTTITATGTTAGRATATSTTTARTTATTTVLKTAITTATIIANYTSWKHVARTPYIHMLVSQDHCNNRRRSSRGRRRHHHTQPFLVLQAILLHIMSHFE